ncbi:uncharacterized protein LOC110023888 [Phalaenopsis equestris]|uniref:uncharacterized protein LOC110023888 n=1 Tax=Phalaenopsis equestris TaxID=78828 RepID=UPI0009E5F7D6|nr:uncharacterized protein LOC110023888 [Phalaenopsis equestris]
MQARRFLLHQQPARASPAGNHRPSAPSFEAQLHAVSRPPSKPLKKLETQRPPRFYRIDPMGFRHLVQALTGKPKSPALAELRWSPASATSPEILQQEWKVPDLECWNCAEEF